MQATAKKSTSMRKPTAAAVIRKSPTAEPKGNITIYPPPEVHARIAKARVMREGMLPMSLNQWVLSAILDKLEAGGH